MLKKEMICVLGHQDIPVIQEQPEFMVDLLQTNLLLFGTSMSGKTNFLKLLITVLHKQYRECDEQMFILDFGGALSEFETLPLVAAYFDNSNEEYVKRVFKLLDDQLKDNISKLKGKNYCSCDNAQPIHTTLFIDNVNAFLDEPRYATYQEKLAKICRDGLSKGITIVMTASSTKGLSQYMNSFKQKIALEMPVENYLDIFSHKVIPVGNNPGHGYANVTLIPKNITGTFPMQTAYEIQLNFADNIHSGEFEFNVQKYFADRTVKKYKRFPQVLDQKGFDKLVEDNKEDENITEQSAGNKAIVGLDYTECKPFEVNYDSARVIAIYGKKEFGKTNLLRRMLKEMLVDENYRFVFFDDGREQLKKYISDEVTPENRKKYINGIEEHIIKQKDIVNRKVIDVTVKLSPIQLFIKCIHENFMDLTGIKRLSNSVFTEVFGNNMYLEPSSAEIYNKNTVFVLQSKFLYMNTIAAKIFMEIILPSMAAQAEEKNWIFIFADVKNINDSEIRDNFNSVIETAFLLDNIAEFVSERGQKSVFGNMDVKSLKDEYAHCEIGDGYVYSIEKDELVKVKFIKEDGV
ncbi:MAG: FtsK/SpoIIIE domain-containing protein [Acutalibacteraceae bacterium]|nr:FtsK/SpoIIIE domain-containing protein [Acutalibacteraceae bacterium]